MTLNPIFLKIVTQINLSNTNQSQDGATEIDTLGRPSSSRSDTSGRCFKSFQIILQWPCLILRSEASDLSASSPVIKQSEQTVHVIDEKAEVEKQSRNATNRSKTDNLKVRHMDEVFEAFISARNVEPSELGFEDDFISREEVVDQTLHLN